MLGTGKSAFHNGNEYFVNALKFSNQTTVKISDALHSPPIYALDYYGHKESVTLSDYAELVQNKTHYTIKATKYTG